MKSWKILFFGTLLATLLAAGGCDQDLGGLSAPTLTGTVTINGTANVGEELAAVFTPGEGQAAAVDSLEKHYLWQRKAVAEDSEWNDITEADTASGTYTLTDGDEGNYIRVLVSVTGYRGSIAPETPAGPVGAATDDGESYTAWVAFASGDNITGVTQSEIEDEGEAERTWTLDVVEEPLAVFAVQKQAGQTITVDGADAAKVRKADNGETLGAGSYKQIDGTSGEAGDTNTYTGFTADSTKDVFAVDMEDLLFDGNFGGEGHTGTETRTFTLTVAEEGKTSRTVSVNLNITLDPDTETSIYHREGTPGAYRYEKVRDAALTDADKKNTVQPEGYAAAGDFTALTLGPVTDLQNAFVWVDKHGVGGGTIGSGAPAGYTEGTTEGYSEYRLFLKKDQQIGKITLAFVNSTATKGAYNNDYYAYEYNETDTRDGISIQLYGAGTGGAAEKTITINTDYSTAQTTQEFNYSNSSAQKGLISLFRPYEGNINYFLSPDAFLKYKALILGKNITLSGGGDATPFPPAGFGDKSGYPWYRLSIDSLIYISYNATLIMEDHAKITGLSTDSSYSPIVLAYSARFYMKGGTITGNTSAASQGVVNVANSTDLKPYIKKTGGTVTGNTNNSVTLSNNQATIEGWN